MEEEELKRRAFERCVESSRPLPPLAVKGRDVLDDDDFDDNLAALKEREDAEKAGEYLERLMMMKEDDFDDGKKKARRCAEMLGPVDAFGREMPFKLEFYMILVLEEEEELGMVEKLTRLGGSARCNWEILLLLLLLLLQRVYGNKGGTRYYLQL